MKAITTDFAKRFKKTYAYKMGGTQTIVFPNGQEFNFDDRVYYSGRGGKYNAAIKHDNIGRVEISAKEFKAVMKKERETQKSIKLMIAERKAKAIRIDAAKKQGVYSKAGNYIELSDNESEGRYFDPARLAKTLDISLKDAELLKSTGKTYVFAKKLDGSGILELYHSSLSCNALSIIVSEATPERMAEFNHNEWAAAPFAEMVGMTENINHFVC